MRPTSLLAACALLAVVAGCAAPRPETRSRPIAAVDAPAGPTRTAAFRIDGLGLDLGEDALEAVRGLEPIDPFCAVGKIARASIAALTRASPSRHFAAPRATAPPGERGAIDVRTERAYLSDFVAVSGTAVPAANPQVDVFSTGIMLDIAPTVAGLEVGLDVRASVAVELGPPETIDVRLASDDAVLAQGTIERPRVHRLEFARRFNLAPDEVGLVLARESDGGGHLLLFSATPEEETPGAR